MIGTEADRVGPLTALVRRLAALFGLYLVLRALFFLLNLGKFADVQAKEILDAYAFGVIFDASAIVSLSIPFIFFSLLPFPFLASSGYQFFLRALYFIPNALFLIPAIIDLEFYKFTDRHMTTEIWNMRHEASEQLGQLLVHYKWVALLVLMMFGTLWWLYPRGREIRYRKAWTALLLYPCATLACALVIRGSVGVRPLSSGHAFCFRTPALGNLALNTPFTLIKSIQGRLEGGMVDPVHYLADDQEARKEVLAARPRISAPARKRDYHNVFVIIVESLSSEYVGFEPANQGKETYTPFLDSLAAKGMAFTNHFANSKRSITALPAILAGIPDWMPGGFSTSVYQSNTIYGLGHGLMKHGYSTWFFHGTRNGTMTFDYMSRVSGFNHYYALNEYGTPAPGDHDRAWGVFDEPMLQRAVKVVSRIPEPFGAALFTLSTHQPFSVPAKYKGRFRKGTRPIHEAVGYADFALQRFFEEASRHEWFKRTLFVITGDHTSFMEPRPEYNTPLGAYDVPLVFYHPAQALPKADPRKIAQQTDIAPSVLDVLGLTDHAPFPFGQSLFRDGEGLALLRISEQFALLKKNYYMVYADDVPPRLFPFDSEEKGTGAQNAFLPDESVVGQYKRLIQAHIQLFKNGLVTNSWFERDQADHAGRSQSLELVSRDVQ